MFQAQLTGRCSAADRPALVQQYLQQFDNHTFDVMIMPMTPATAPPIYGCSSVPLPDMMSLSLHMHTHAFPERAGPLCFEQGTKTHHLSAAWLLFAETL